MKKLTRFLAFFVACIVLIMLLLPLAFNGKATGIIEKQCDKHLMADVRFSKLRLNLFRAFPDVSVTLTDLTVAGVDTFRNDTLVKAEKIRLTVNLKSLLSDEGVTIKRVELDKPAIYAKVLADGRANWNITKPDTTPEKEADTTSVTLKIKKITIKDAHVVYDDRESSMLAVIDNWSGTLKGNLSSDKTLLETKSAIGELSFSKGNFPFLNKVKVKADMAMDADFKHSKYTFKTNRIKLNDMDVSVDGYVQMPDTSTVRMDLTLNTQKVDFKELLSLVPSIYRKNFSSVKTTGNLTCSAFVKGDMTETVYPAFDVKLAVKEASFQYPSLPSSVTQIGIDAHISSAGGPLDHVKVDIPKFHMNMAGNPIDATLFLTTPMSDPDFKATVKGILDLGKIKEVYPLDKGTTLKGRIKANLSAAGRMSYVENGRYEQFKASGTATATGLRYVSTGLPTVDIRNATIALNPKQITLSALSLLIGKNDVQATGSLSNFIPWFFKNKTLTGHLNVTSMYLNLNDLMSKSTGAAVAKTTKKASAPMTAFQVPKNLDLSLNATGKEVIFNKLTMEHVQGNVGVRNGQVTLKNLSANALGGSIGVNGYYEATSVEKPVVDFNLVLQKVSFKQMFSTFTMVKSLVPIFEKTQGDFSMNLQFNTLMDKYLNPDLMTLTGKGRLRSDNVSVSGVKAMDLLATTLKNESLRTIAPKNLNIPFSINKGRVHTSPFDLTVGTTKLNFEGSTGIDKTIDYKVNVTLPSGLSQRGLTSLKGTIGGTFTKPTLKLDMQDLAKQMTTTVADKLSRQLSGATVNENVAKAKDELNKKAAEIRAQAKIAGDKLIQEAETEGNKLVEKAKNPLVKAAAKLTAEKMKAEAKKKAADLEVKAEEKIKALEASYTK